MRKVTEQMKQKKKQSPTGHRGALKKSYSTIEGMIRQSTKNPVPKPVVKS